MTMLKQYFIAILSIALLAGCSTNLPLENPDYRIENWEGRLARGWVGLKMDKKIQAEWIDEFEDDEFHLFGMGGYTREQLKNDFDIVNLRVRNNITDDYTSGGIFARSELNLEFHDVVDFYTGLSDEEAERVRLGMKNLGYSNLDTPLSATKV